MILPENMCLLLKVQVKMSLWEWEVKVNACKWKGWDNPCCFSQEKLEKICFRTVEVLKVKKVCDFIFSVFIKYETL